MLSVCLNAPSCTSPLSSSGALPRRHLWETRRGCLAQSTRVSSRLAVRASGDNGNGSASSQISEPHYQSSITLKRLLAASKHLGVPDPMADVDPAEAGKGLRGLSPRAIGEKPACGTCNAIGAVECLTCSCSGLYTDPVLESQGVMVKVKCLGCGGTGAILCSSCGGRGFFSAASVS